MDFEDKCPICLEKNSEHGPLAVGDTPNRVVPCCLKLFHVDCINQWVNV